MSAATFLKKALNGDRLTDRQIGDRQVLQCSYRAAEAESRPELESVFLAGV